MRPKIAIIGAGWAGLSAAKQLNSHAEVHIFEASKQAGGRARGLKHTSADFGYLDNGQHLLLGAYHHVLAMKQECDVAKSNDTERLPSQWHQLDGLNFQAKTLSSPMHIIFGILTAKNWSRKDKVRLLQDAYALKNSVKWLVDFDMNVEQWLLSRKTPQKQIDEFWHPLVAATMNTPPAIASLHTLATVVIEGLLGGRQDSDFCLPKCDLSTWWVEPVQNFLRQKGVQFHWQQRISDLSHFLLDGKYCINGIHFDRVIIATAPYHVLDVLGETLQTSVNTYFNQLSYSAITTVYLRYTQTLPLPYEIQGLAYGHSHWLINREKLGMGNFEVAAVISLSESLPFKTNTEWVEAVHQDLLSLQADLTYPIASQVITEKRATIHTMVNRALPPMAALNKSGIYLAGDYCHPKYPATLEGAVQSGSLTAALCMADWKSK